MHWSSECLHCSISVPRQVYVNSAEQVQCTLHKCQTKHVMTTSGAECDNGIKQSSKSLHWRFSPCVFLVLSEGNGFGCLDSATHCEHDADGELNPWLWTLVTTGVINIHALSHNSPWGHLIHYLHAINAYD